MPECPLYRIFDILGVQFSLDNHVLPSSVIVGGDGTSLAAHASSRGHSIPDDVQNRRFSDADADIGWDSDIQKCYFGYTGYNISCHVKDSCTDLPLFLTLFKASRHDALNCMDSIVWFKSVNSSVSVSHCCFDSASDNYSTHHLLSSLNIIPVIDINRRGKGKNIYKPYENISANGNPICIAGLEMKHNGYEQALERHKYRCPYGKNSNQCPFKAQCTPAKYGRVAYIKSSADSKLFGPVPYGSEEWKQIYKNRTCTERINNRIINDYKFIANNHMHGRKRNLFMLMMVGINIHLDAFYKICSK